MLRTRKLIGVAIILVIILGCIKKSPKILIIGDSISIGYTPFVKDFFEGTAIVEHNIGNAQHTGNGLKKIEEWIGDEHWDIIQINWGLWDLCYRHPDSKVQGKRDKLNGEITNTIEVYKSNLDAIVSILKKKTKAKLIFVTTTYVPENEAGRFQEDVIKYNDAAKAIMKKHSVAVNDIYQKSIAIHDQFGRGNDNVHYNKDGYEQLSKLIIDNLSLTLNK